MNHSYRFQHVLLAAALLGASFSSQANIGRGNASAPTPRIGQWIAKQTQAALRDIREDLKRQLAETLKPLRPAVQPIADTNDH